MSELATAIGWDLPSPFHIDLVVGDECIDDYGHANNTAYPGWLERVVWAHSEAVGLGIEDFRRLGRAMVVRRTELDYARPAMAGDSLRVANWVVATDGRVSARRQFQIARLADGETLLRGQILYACIDLETGRPRRMPEVFVRSYAVEKDVSDALLAMGRRPDRAR